MPYSNPVTHILAYGQGTTAIPDPLSHSNPCFKTPSVNDGLRLLELKPNNLFRSYVKSPLPRTPSPTPLFPARRSSSRYPLSSRIRSNACPLKPSLKACISMPSTVLEGQNKSTKLHAKPPTSPQKTVRFPEKEGGLEIVKEFSRNGRPASLSRCQGQDTETETESESILPIRSGTRSRSFLSTRYPISPPSTHLKPQHFELDQASSSIIPSPCPSPSAHVHLETLTLSTAPTASSHPAPILIGTVVVRNVAYEKNVKIRFTLDNWQTISEVSAHHIASLPSIPATLIPPRTPTSAILPTSWDRFAFTIRLEDYAQKLHKAVVWFAARFSIANEEWWDNNGGKNYKASFRLKGSRSP